MALTKINNNTLSSAGIATGRVLQVKQVTSSSNQTVTATSYTAITFFSVAITPSATSSKILISCTTGVRNTTADKSNYLTLYRDSTNLGTVTAQGFGTLRVNATVYSGNVTFSFLDTPSSTSQLHYEAYVKRNAGSGNLYLNYNSGATSTITAMEVGA